MSRENGASHGISLGDAFRVWVRIGLLSFGGPRRGGARCHVAVQGRNDSDAGHQRDAWRNIQDGLDLTGVESSLEQ